ncbi:MAG: GTPase [Candidatus Micrarchaeia archaeon]
MDSRKSPRKGGRYATGHAGKAFRGKSSRQQKMMASDWVAREAWDCNVMLELVDIRNIDGTRIPFLKKFGSVDKILTIANKKDLATPQLLQACRDRGLLAISATSPDRSQTRRAVLDAIMAKSKRNQIKVAIFGYPNAGKSTLVNLLVNRKKASVSPVAFTTKGRQYFRLNDRVLLVDLPGIYPGKQEKEDLLFKGAVNVNGLQDPEMVFFSLFERKSADPAFFAWLEGEFELAIREPDRHDAVAVLEKIALRRGLLLKGGNPDTQMAARIVLLRLADAPFSA